EAAQPGTVDVAVRQRHGRGADDLQRLRPVFRLFHLDLQRLEEEPGEAADGRAVVDDEYRARQLFPPGCRSAVILRDKEGTDKLPILLRSTESGRFSLQPSRWPDPRVRVLPPPARTVSPPPAAARRARTGAGRARRSRPRASPSARRCAFASWSRAR